MRLAEIFGLPPYSQMPKESEEVMERWMKSMRKSIEQMIMAGVIISLADWADFEEIEKALVAKVNQEMLREDIIDDVL